MVNADKSITENAEEFADGNKKVDEVVADELAHNQAVHNENSGR